MNAIGYGGNQIRMVEGRKKTGSVYTKKWIVDGMLNLIGYFDNLPLYSFSILEPSCGEGNFLVSIVERLLIAAHRDSILAENLKGCIFACDINDEALKIASSKLRPILEKYQYPVSLINDWLHKCDFLLSELPMFDFVIGNPPYVRATQISENDKKQYLQIFETVSRGTDLYVGFIEQSLKHIKPTGKLCFICADRWMQNAYGKKLRAFIKRQFCLNCVLKLSAVDAFEDDVSAYPAIVEIGKRKTECYYAECYPKFNEASFEKLCNEKKSNVASTVDSTYSSCFLNESCFPENDVWRLCNSRFSDVIQRIVFEYPLITDVGVEIGIGMATGLNDAFIVSRSDGIERECLLPTLAKGDVKMGKLPDKPLHWLVNPWDEHGCLVNLDEFPGLKAHLMKFKNELSNRFTARNKPEMWYRTIDKPRRGLQKSPKILIADLQLKPEVLLDNGLFYPSHNFYWLRSECWNLEALAGVLMSDFIAALVSSTSVKMRGNTLRFQAQYLKKLHIPQYSSVTPDIRIGLVEAFRAKDVEKANAMVAALYSLDDGEVEGIKNGF